MNITLKDVPPELHEQLRKAAERSGRSLNKMILYTLERTVCASRADRPELLKRIRRRRKTMSAWLEDEPLQRAIGEGRQ
jgi:hypothetical protein